ncbi:MAG: hypothetical protein NT028_09130 [candidate division Zixibacteria bacterium]|nr:hypothetical protein [candidate division Zixibacteria bacterium]
MSLTTAWRQPYETLLHELQQRHGGEIITPSEESSSAFAGQDYIGHSYPSLRFTAENTPFFIELSREYQLHIYAIGHTPADFKLYQRGFIERMRALLGVDGDVRSHNPEFDRRFATNTDAKDKSGQLRKTEVQQLILSLMPFVFIRFHEGGLQLARDIGPDTDLEVSAIERTITSLAKLLEIAS